MMKPRVLYTAVLAACAITVPLVATAAAGPTTIPLHVEEYGGVPRLGIDVMFGTKTLRFLFDTGSGGLRVLASAVPPDAAQRTGASASGGYASGIMLHGEQAIARLSIADPSVVQSTQIELVDSITCADQRPNCPAANGGTPVMFGRLFSGIFGASNATVPRGGCCINPFEAFNEYGKQYLVHANMSAPTVTLKPDSAMLAKFTMIPVPRNLMPRGCIHIPTAVNDICGEVLFDTGAPGIQVTTNTIAANGQVRAEIPARLTIGTWSHTFASAKTPVFVALVRGNTNNIIIGLAGMQSVDVFYDLAGERMGLFAAQ